MPPPDDWDAILPAGTSPKEVWGFDPRTGKPKDWPLLFSTVPWSARLEGLAPGSYEFRARDRRPERLRPAGAAARIRSRA